MTTGHFGKIGAVIATACMLYPAVTSADTVHTLIHQGVERHFELHLPPGQTTTPLPLVISLQGNRQPLDSLRRWLRLAPVADREGFAIAYPVALNNRWSYGRPVAGDMPAIRGEPADDVGFIRGMIDRLVANGTADATRVYATGSSRGGLMSYALACTITGRIAAFAPLISGMTDHQRADCQPGSPRPMLVLAGSADLVQRYDGWLLSRGRLLSVPETMEFWRSRFGCTGQKSKPLPRLDANDRTQGIGVVHWTGCTAGSALVLYRVFGGGHVLPMLSPMSWSGQFARAQNRDIETAETVWSFFKDVRLTR
mgnify:CR=1 FL=1|jgi:polyhydroxybutyrate depolymerase